MISTMSCKALFVKRTLSCFSEIYLGVSELLLEAVFRIRNPMYIFFGGILIFAIAWIHFINLVGSHSI